MRTIKRHSMALNFGKQQILRDMARAYAREKDYWLGMFQRSRKIHLIKQHRKIRDEQIKANYKSPNGLQARMWKLALIDAAETMDKYWQALFVVIRSLVHHNQNLTKEQKQYCFWILNKYEQFEDLLNHHFRKFDGLSAQEIKQAGNYLNRIIRRERGKLPRVKSSQSFTLDGECYSLFEHEGRQYIKIMTLQRGRRLVIPLTGNTPIKGNIRLVLDNSNLNVHYTGRIKADAVTTGVISALDFGYTEVATDSEGNHYGKYFGELMTKASDNRKFKGIRRNKLYALQKKYDVTDDPAKRNKARHIKAFNLGNKKQGNILRRTKATLECEINRGLNQFLRNKRPSIIVTEDLRHLFMFGKGKNWNRRLSAWVKGALGDRIEFKALAGGSRHEQVNPAYSSQTCPVDGYVDSKNRTGDRFKCLFCGHEDNADRVAALNHLARYDDDEITRYTSYREAKAILLKRFHRRLETAQVGTVPGRTPKTVNLLLQADRKTMPLIPGGHLESETR